MPTQSQSAENQAERKQRIEDRLTPTPESTTGQAALAHSPNVPQTGDGLAASLQAQANALSHPGLPLLQWQRMAGQITNTFGSTPMLQVVVAP